MRYFPAFLDLTGKRCLVAGAGEVGRRKITRLLDCGPEEVLVVDPRPPKDMVRDLKDRSGLRFEHRFFQPGDIQGRFLVIASTGQPETNILISRLCRENSILCNIVDQPEYCSFIVPALLNRGDLNIAVSTGGSSPALAGKIKNRLSKCYGPEYETWLALLRKIRPLVLTLGLSQAENKKIFHSLTEDEILQRIQTRDRQDLLSSLRQRLPQAVHAQLGDVLHDLL
ncbi:MAG: bifunctional precorrin-2 dehydrogenase/sirohydrochlorin ferrochelatase [Desulfohalobiaceae bacterium]|nr:bifunctional precorrin-2 dehydrogenase/sirohydrochlorin ferrochelatase [Desulfohalobiaceae bacterium]